MNALFEEHIRPHIPAGKILSKDHSDTIFFIFEYMFPIHYFASRIDWDHVPRHIYLRNLRQASCALKKLLQRNYDISLYILWSNAALPVVQSHLQFAVRHADSIYCVAPDAWLLHPGEGYVIEIFHEGEIVVGISPEM